MASKKELKRVSSTLESEWDNLADDLDDYFAGMQIIVDAIDTEDKNTKKAMFNAFKAADKSYTVLQDKVLAFIALQKKMNEGDGMVKTFAQILAEMTAHRRDAENAKAMKRIEDFWTRSKGDRAKFTAQINLRTRKMTKKEKVQIWASELENQNFHDEAEVAFKRLKELGG